MSVITLSEAKAHQSKRKKLKSINDIKALGQEIREKHNLTDKQSIDTLNGINNKVLTVLGKIKRDAEGNLYYEFENGLKVIIDK